MKSARRAGAPDVRKAGWCAILGRILSHCNRQPTNRASMTTGSRWAFALCAVCRTLVRMLLREPLHPRARAVAVRSVFAACSSVALIAAHPAYAVYAIAQYGEPKYPPNFTHFDYVNPNAPKGGTLVLANPDRLTSFDKFNPFTMRGNSAPGLGMLFESLTTGRSDEVASAYG